MYSTHLSRVLTTELSSRSQAYTSCGGGGGVHGGGERGENARRRGEGGECTEEGRGCME